MNSLSLHQGMMKFNMCSKVFKKNLAPLAFSRMIVSSACSKSNVKLQDGEDFWEKNKRFNRPMSPHLTIYKPQLTSMLSITHRGTGVFLSAVIYGTSIGMLALPGSYPHYLEMLVAMPLGSAFVLLAKFGLSFSFFFHLNNGIRHLFWDLGYGFALKNLYQSGWFVVGSAAVAAAAVSLL